MPPAIPTPPEVTILPVVTDVVGAVLVNVPTPPTKILPPIPTPPPTITAPVVVLVLVVVFVNITDPAVLVILPATVRFPPMFPFPPMLISVFTPRPPPITAAPVTDDVLG